MNYIIENLLCYLCTVWPVGNIRACDTLQILRMRNAHLSHALLSGQLLLKLKMSSMNSASHQDGCPPSKKARLEGANEEGWKVKASRESHDCVNPVRSCEEIYFKEALEKRDKSKELIKVSIGENIKYLTIRMRYSYP